MRRWGHLVPANHKPEPERTPPVKIIGVEFRVGYSKGFGGTCPVAELFLHPVDVDVPVELTYPVSPHTPVAKLTVHTSLGDVDATLCLPRRDTPDEIYRRAFSREYFDTLAREWVQKLGGA